MFFMKKLLALLLALVMLLSMAACGASDDDDDDDDKKEKTSDKKDKDEDKDEDDDKKPSWNIELDDEDEDDEKKPAKATFEEILVVDNSECKVVITGVEEDDFWGYVINVHLENKSADTNYCYDVDYLAINGVLVDGYLYETVEAGEEIDADITIMGLEDIDIGDYTDIEVAIEVSDAEDYLADSVAYEVVHIYPYGEENATVYEKKIEKTDAVLIDNEYATVIATGYTEDEIWGYTVNIYVENKTTENYTFSIKNAAVNGLVASSTYYQELPGGMKAFNEISFSEMEYDVGEYTDIELIYEVSLTEDWSADPVVLETVHYYPQGENKATTYERPAQSSDVVVLDNEYVTVIAIGADVDDFWGYRVNFYLINKTDANVMFSGRDILINGCDLGVIMVEEVAPGKSAYSFMYWDEDKMTENNISALETVEFTMTAYDHDNYMTDYYAEESVTLTF